ncbi:MAG TPA: GNAT family N-acetyltransferase [Candidatus Angelobacter sp.]|nr:GNAT family N-acetyltransferase [Candidatus Angelobacter sp.]
MSISLATNHKDIQRCFPVMAQLRPHLKETEFVERVKRQQEAGYHLAFLAEKIIVKAVAGYRFSESLSWGRFMYVDDLVTAEDSRSQGHGQKLFRWLIGQARGHKCDQLHLDSGVQRFGAHRFYLASRMDIIAHHFAMKL